MADIQEDEQGFEPEEFLWTPSCTECGWAGDRTSQAAAEIRVGHLTLAEYYATAKVR